MEEIRHRLEEKFDPTDTDLSMRIAYKSLTLMRCAHQAIETDNANLRMGRDQKGDLFDSIIEVATGLGFLSAWASGEEINEFFKELGR